MILLDTSGLLAAIDADQPRHQAVAAALRTAAPPRILSPFVLAELDYLISRRRVGRRAQLALLNAVAIQTYRIEPFDAGDVEEARGVVERYGDLDVGLADASLVVLANRYATRDVLTLDERHFRVMRGPRGRPFRLLPADAT